MESWWVMNISILCLVLIRCLRSLTLWVFLRCFFLFFFFFYPLLIFKHIFIGCRCKHMLPTNQFLLVCGSKSLRPELATPCLLNTFQVENIMGQLIVFGLPVPWQEYIFILNYSWHAYLNNGLYGFFTKVVQPNFLTSLDAFQSRNVYLSIRKILLIHLIYLNPLNSFNLHIINCFYLGFRVKKLYIISFFFLM